MKKIPYNSKQFGIGANVVYSFSYAENNSFVISLISLRILITFSLACFMLDTK